MAALTCTRDSPESWTFEMPLHYLCFSLDAWDAKGMKGISPASCPSSSDSNSSSASQKRVQARPHNLRPWTQIIYNEGTVLPGYARYEWNLNNPPLILPTLLNFIHRECNFMRRERECERSPIIKLLTCISNFPFAQHVKDIF